MALSKSVQGRKTRDPVDEDGEAVIKLMAMLERLRALVKEHPPHEIRSRFGNMAFRGWLAAAIAVSSNA